jgi:glucose/arabinose dehydrogenase
MTNRPLILILVSLLSFVLGQTQELPEGFIIEVFASGIEQPVCLVEAPDGRIFVAERTGKIRIIQNGELLENPFYEVQTETPGERGVTGIVLHPDFETNGFLYIHYTIVDSNQNAVIRVTAAGNSAPENSQEQIFLLDPMWASWHNGGSMFFDDENFLFIGVGDGTGWQAAEQTTTTLGKILRLHDDGSIPIDNPFFDSTDGNNRAIWAIGVRNPYTMARQNSSGRIFFNDVGNNLWEEINELIEGAHYGWGNIEGPIQAGQVAPPEYQDPLYAYDHSQGCAVVGSDFYEPLTLAFPESYFGKYFFMDYCQGTIYTMDPATYDISSFVEGLQLSNFLCVSNDGSLLVSEIYNNRILKISYAGDGSPYIIEQPLNVETVPGESYGFAVNAAGSDPLSYQWYKNGLPIDNASASFIQFDDVLLSDDGDQYHCTVSNVLGTLSSDTVLLTVIDESRPEIVMISPLPESTYQAGDTLWFEAIAMDLEDGQIAAENFTWNLFFHHNVHLHPALTNITGVQSGYYVIPNAGETAIDVWFEVIVKVEDSAGLEQSASVEVHPQIAQFSVQSSAVDFTFSLDGASKQSGQGISSVAGLIRSIELPEFVIQSNQLFQFQDWGNGDNSLLLEFSASDTTLSPIYTFLHEYSEGDESEDLNIEFYAGIGSEREFYSSTTLERVDVNWSLGGPFQWEDFPSEYSVIISGSILAPYTGLYNLHLLHDGQTVFTIEDSVYVVNTAPWGNMEINEFQIYLEAGNKYNFSIDYEHYDYISRVMLSWSFSELDPFTIPSSHLFGPFHNTSTGTQEDLLLYPNPSTGEVSVQLNSVHFSSSDQLKVFIINSQGKLIREVPLFEDSKTFSTSELSPGHYFLWFSSNSVTKTSQFIVK